MSPLEALGLFSRIQELHARRDPAGVRELFTDDVAVDDDGGEAVRGSAAMERFLLRVWRAFPDFGVELLEGPYVDAGAAGFAVRGRLGGTMRGPLDPPGFGPTNRPVASEFGGFYEIRGERICRARIIIDTRELAVQLRALPAPGGAGEGLAAGFQRLRALGLRWLG